MTGPIINSPILESYLLGPAQICRDQGWSVGDVIIGVGPDGERERCRITAIGLRYALCTSSLSPDDETCLELGRPRWKWIRLIPPDDPPPQTWRHSVLFWSCVVYFAIATVIALLSMVFDRRSQ